MAPVEFLGAELLSGGVSGGNSVGSQSRAGNLLLLLQIDLLRQKTFPTLQLHPVIIDIPWRQLPTILEGYELVCLGICLSLGYP